MKAQSTNNLADIFFNLSVNFLLYVVLIIVFYMLVRFYLEEETESTASTQSSRIESRNFGYVPVSTNDDDIELVDSGQLIEKNTGIEIENVIQSEISSKAESTLANESLLGESVHKSNSFLNVNEWNNSEETKDDVIRRVVYCALGLNISFCIWGLIQERILTQTYGGEFFVYSYGLVFMSRLGGLILSSVLMKYYKVPWVPSALWEYSFPAVANMLSSWCQYEALKYVSFPLAMLAKAFKMVPVMLMGKLMNNKSYESYEYLSGATVGFGLYLFMSSSEQIDLRQNVMGDPASVRGALCGVVLLLLFLLFDSFTGQWQTRMFQLNKQLSPLQMMLIMNAFSAVFSFVTLVHQEELSDSLLFVLAHPDLLLHVALFCLCSTVGQLFIFYTVKNFGAVVFAIIMSVRILFSTLLSCLVYRHPVSELGLLGILVVFGAITCRLQRKTRGKPLLVLLLRDRADWGPREQEQVLREWHEHIDI